MVTLPHIVSGPGFKKLHKDAHPNQLWLSIGSRTHRKNMNFHWIDFRIKNTGGTTFGRSYGILDVSRPQNKGQSTFEGRLDVNRCHREELYKPRSSARHWGNGSRDGQGGNRTHSGLSASGSGHFGSRLTRCALWRQIGEKGITHKFKSPDLCGIATIWGGTAPTFICDNGFSLKTGRTLACDEVGRYFCRGQIYFLCRQLLQRSPIPASQKPRLIWKPGHVGGGAETKNYRPQPRLGRAKPGAVAGELGLGAGPPH